MRLEGWFASEGREHTKNGDPQHGCGTTSENRPVVAVHAKRGAEDDGIANMIVGGGTRVEGHTKPRDGSGNPYYASRK